MLKSKFISFFLLNFALLILCSVGAIAQTPEKVPLPPEKNPLATGKNPVIIIPGIQGSQLVNPETGKSAWFNVRRDKDDDLRLPMTSNNLTRNRDKLVATDIIREVKLPGVLPDVEVYQGLIDSLKARGYAEADWNKPQAMDVFYVFPYDWRRDNVEAARLLIQKIEAVKRSVKRPDLKFDIIAHSMGGLIARYAAMYGAADLAPEGKKPAPTWAGARHIYKILMFGTPNEGSFDAFIGAVNGSTVVSTRNLPFVDDFRPEDVISSPALFQLMPHQTATRFLDENLKPLKVNLYEPKTWETYGWGAIGDPKFLSKLKDAAQLAAKNKEIKPVKSGKDANFDDRILSQTTSAQVRAYFGAVLSRAKRFHLALDAPTRKSPVELYAFGGNCQATLDAIVLVRNEKKDRWETISDARDIKTSSGREIKKDELKAVMFTLGDGRVTRRSLLAESEESKGGTEQLVKTVFPLKSSFFACGLHTQLFLEKTIQDSFLSALVVEKTQTLEK
jgi:pimeloyl-ACP methyl ester carboxylesterase